MIKLVRLELINFKQYQKAEIDFPEQGKILIKGKNEAGKSSIFEAIAFALFGKPIYVGTKSNLIRFNSDRAKIKLVVKTNEKIITIERILSKNETQSATLFIHKIGENKPEVISGVKNVDPRIVRETRIDQDIFINTCFIGQKRLETLEGLDAKKREELISKLFNLERFLNLLNKAKEIRKELIEQKNQYEIIKKASDAKKLLPEIEKELKNIRYRLEEINKIEVSHKILSLEEEMQTLVREIACLEEEAQKLKTDVELLEKCKEVENLLNEIRNVEEKISILETQKEEVLEKIKDLEEKIKREPEVIEKINFLSENIEIKKQIENINKFIIEEKNKILKTEEIIPILLEKVNKYKEIENKINKETDLLRKLDLLERDLQSIDLKIKNLKKREEKVKNISEKILKNFPKFIQDYQRALELKEKENLLNKLNSSLLKTRKKLLLFLAFLSLSIAFGFSISYLFFIPSVILMILTLLLYKNYSSIAKQHLKEKNIIEFIKREISSNITEKSLDNLREEFRELQEKEKNKKDQKERLFQKINQKLFKVNNKLTITIEEKIKTEEELRNINELKREAETILSDLTNKLKCENNIKSIEEKLSKAQEVLEKKRIEISIKERDLENLKNCDKTPDKDLTILTSEKGYLESELKNIKISKKELEEQRKQYDQLENQLRTEYIKLQELKQKIKSSEKQYIEKLKETIKILEEKKVKEKYEEVLSQLNNKKGQKHFIEGEYNKYIQDFKTKFPHEDWRDYSKIAIDSSERERLEKREEELLQKIGEQESILREYENKTGKSRETLIPEKVEGEYKNLERNIQKMDYAIKIIEDTRESKLKSVLPNTMIYMQKILPILTSDRYHYAEIDENYRLKVYTSENNIPLEKNIFSGGTQDQLSLALRLSFAMATLPQEKGLQPKFIFLDEPLGSFDEDRAKGLLYLLTQGEIAEFFDQIFVVTHIPIEEDLFDEIYYVDNGNIIKAQKT